MGGVRKSPPPIFGTEVTEHQGYNLGFSIWIHLYFKAFGQCI